ncbi:hypothetical protein B0H11DRAFT_1953393 [Mycena galericulata]|nr:hypothetical protein B0H11DRAFT_1953393 [Mycena galericulata]
MYDDRLSLHVPHGHYGRLKYDPALARLRWNVDFLVEVVADVLVQIVAARLNDTAITIDWTDPLDTRAWLVAAKSDAEAILVASGVSQSLEQAKNAARRSELVLNFLRAMTACKRRHDRWVALGGQGLANPRRGFLAAPKDQRQQQLDDILEQAREADSFDLPVDPNHLGSWRHPILSESFATWFIGLKDGTDVVQASNALGRTEESHKAAMKNQQALGDWNRTHKIDRSKIVDTAAIDRKNLVEVAMATAKLGTYVYEDMSKSWRMGVCGDCGMFLIGGHNAAYHRCVSGERRTLTGGNFSDLERVLYPHDLLTNPAMLAALGDAGFPVRYIFDIQGPTLQNLLQPQDWAALSPVLSSDASVYVSELAADNDDLLLTHAVDVILTTKSTCPTNFLPVNFASRQAWNEGQANMLNKWFVSRTHDLYLVACDGPLGKAEARFFFPSDEVTKNMDGAERTRRKCPLCNNSYACKRRRFHKVETILDLPPHYARQVWFAFRREVQRPGKKAKSTKREKTRR